MGSGLRIFFVRRRNGGKLPRKPALGPETAGATLVIPGETDRLASLYRPRTGRRRQVVLWAGGDAPEPDGLVEDGLRGRFLPA